MLVWVGVAISQIAWSLPLVSVVMYLWQRRRRQHADLVFFSTQRWVTVRATLSLWPFLAFYSIESWQALQSEHHQSLTLVLSLP